MADNSTFLTLKDSEIFDHIFDILVKDLASEISDEDADDALKWFHRVNEYNVPHGRRIRGLAVIKSFRFLADENKLTGEALKQAAVVGWCIEWLQASLIIIDDIMDASITRRGRPCWYKVDGVGMCAMNDSVYLESAVYVLLKKYLKGQPYYGDLVDIFHQATMQTIIGQNLDMITAPSDRVDFTKYTMERYKTIVKFKTSFYSFYLPIACAMIMAGITDQEFYDAAKIILLQMGELFQIQNDYLDCFGDLEVTGKIGTDIEEKKCSWLIVQALQLANKEQKTLLQENYGRCQSECVAKVRGVYEALKLKQLYESCEESMYNEVLELIDTTKVPLAKDMFRKYLSNIYKYRQKR